MRIGSHRNSLHQDLLDPFFAVFAFKFAVMTAVVVAVVSDQPFVVTGYMGDQQCEKLSNLSLLLLTSPPSIKLLTTAKFRSTTHNYMGLVLH